MIKSWGGETESKKSVDKRKENLKEKERKKEEKEKMNK